ncbi:MAG: hypothetical protein NC489_10200 [Ruminococcus flavefaciens]|nr:hypothetical protein [Ruminococcus flavefaciens]
MNKICVKSMFLKWLLLPVILCVRLIVISAEKLFVYIPVKNIFCLYENTLNFNQKINTIVDYKVRMNN